MGYLPLVRDPGGPSCQRASIWWGDPESLWRGHRTQGWPQAFPLLSFPSWGGTFSGAGSNKCNLLGAQTLEPLKFLSSNERVGEHFWCCARAPTMPPSPVECPEPQGWVPALLGSITPPAPHVPGTQQGPGQWLVMVIVHRNDNHGHIFVFCGYWRLRPLPASFIHSHRSTCVHVCVTCFCRKHCSRGRE